MARVSLGSKASTWPDFAKALGLRGNDSAGASRVKRWQLGRGEPDYEGTIKMLDAIGAINWAAIEKFLPQPAEGTADRTLGKSAQAREKIASRQARQPRQAQGGSNP